MQLLAAFSRRCTYLNRIFPELDDAHARCKFNKENFYFLDDIFGPLSLYGSDPNVLMVLYVQH